MANYFTESDETKYLADVVLYHPKKNQIVAKAELAVRQHIEAYLTIPDYEVDADLVTNTVFLEAMKFTIADKAKSLAHRWDRDETLEGQSIGPRSENYGRDKSDTYLLLRPYDVTPPIYNL